MSDVGMDMDMDMDTDTVGRCMQPEGMANQSGRPSKVDADALFGAVTVGGIAKLSFNSPIANVRHLSRRLQLP